MENETEQSNPPVEETKTEQSQEPATIADVAKKFNVEEQATEFSETEQTQPTPEPSTDYSYDPDLKTLADQVLASTNATNKRLDELDQREHADRLNRDIREAVKDITKQVDIEPDLAEVFMEHKHRTDPSYKNIWENRHANPEALKAANKIVADEIAKRFKIETDPQLTENIRAAKKSQSTSASAPPTQTKTEEMMSLNDDDFEKEMQRIIRG